MIQRALSAASALFFLLCLVGCGADVFTPYSQQQAAQSEGPLAGNWLIAGNFPFNSVNLGSTFDEFGRSLSAATSIEYRCSGTNNYDINVLVAPTTIGPGGSFTLQSDTYPGTPPSYGLTIQATQSSDVPPAFQGNYSSPQATTACSVPSSPTSFTATRVSDITGTYAGTLSLQHANSPTLVTSPIIIVLQQGGVDPVSGSYSKAIVSGNIALQSAPCVTSGTISAAHPSTWGGIQGDLIFTMNDGSVWRAITETQDVANSKMLIDDIYLDTSGTCGYSASGGSLLTKQ